MLVSKAARRYAIAFLETSKEGKFVEEAAQFVSLITEKGREDILYDIVSAFVIEYNKYAGIISVEVSTAQALDKEQLAKLTDSLEKATSKKVDLSQKVQADLIGGISVKIEDTVIDATVKYKLNQLETLFLESSME